MYKNKKMRIGN